jgi:tRNA (guanine37-N1)-methyltransferase
MRIHILTLFPEFFVSPLGESILKRAQQKEPSGKTPLEINIVNIRDFTTDKHHTTDDHPYGGGAGMVMKVEPIDKALASLQYQSEKKKIILTSAKGKLFHQQMAEEYAELDEITIVCGHYEGVDERVAEHLVDEEVRIGDYVMTGGEPAALVMIDAVTRLLPNVLGNEESIIHESHSAPGYLEHAQYTRPEEYKGWKVPEILLSGHHGEIEKWRKGK